MSKFEIKHRFNDSVLFEAELGVEYDNRSYSVRLGAAVKLAVKARADLAGADLAGADLTGADLTGANLRSADLRSAKWCDGVTINRRPLFVAGLRWSIWILDEHIQIGCELHRLDEWAAFDDRRIMQMAGETALEFWRTHKGALLSLAASDGRGIAQPAEAAE